VTCLTYSNYLPQCDSYDLLNILEIIFMQRFKWIIGICATILLGALGSGLWSVIFEPTLGWLGKVFLSLVTLGMSAARDSVYARAALSFGEFPSVFLMELVGLLVPMVPLLWLVSILPFPVKARSDERIQKSRRMLRFGLLFLCLMGAVITVQCNMVGYAFRVHAHFRQALAICRPYISEHDADVFSSRYARIKTRDQFMAIYGELEAIAHANNVELSPFSPW